MPSRSTIRSHQQRIDAVFQRVSGLDENPELQADLAKYLCVLVAGFIEKSMSDIAKEHAKSNGSPTLQKYVESGVKRFTNANAEKVLQFFGSFSTEWRNDMETFIVDERKSALDSIYTMRNNIAHGENVDLTYRRMVDYYAAVKQIITKAQCMCVPQPAQ